jgi:dihydroorotate dehydrogenase
MGLFDSLVRPALFRLDPEQAHHMAMAAVKSGLVHGPVVSDPVEVAGIRFPNRLGLAAGFDKDAVAVDHWHKLGFGHVEVGTVTRHAQPGNDQPRLFRYPELKAVVNRMGFNNQGADAMARRLEKSHPKIPLGINIGKSKKTEPQDAAEDYAYSLKLLKDFGDYFVVNVSSPNTPGLRGLQERGPLTKILWRLREVESTKPMFVKVAPDLELDALDELASVVRELGLAGIVATNTTIDRSSVPSNVEPNGGLSGAPLTTRADAALAHLREVAPDLVLIGVGGVMKGDDAARKVALGASLVQVYTGWVYGGPAFLAEVATALKACALPSPAYADTHRT